MHIIQSLIKFVAVFAYPFDEVLDEDVLVKAVHQKSNVGVAIWIHPDEVRNNHKRVGSDVFGIQLFQRERTLSGSHVDRVVKVEQEQFEVFFGGKMLGSQFWNELGGMRCTIGTRQIGANSLNKCEQIWLCIVELVVPYLFGQCVKQSPCCRTPCVFTCHAGVCAK